MIEVDWVCELFVQIINKLGYRMGILNTQYWRWKVLHMARLFIAFPNKDDKL